MNFIHHIKSLYPKPACKNLIKWFNHHKNLQQKGEMGQEREPLNNKEIGLRLEQLEDFYGLGKALKKGINNFLLNYPYTDQYGKKWRLDPAMQLMKYEPNQYYKRLHCENDGNSNYLRRAFAWQVFLNTIESGGGTEFVYQKFVAQPIAGDFYMWPAGCTHLHRGVNAPKEIKYIITGWCSYD